jgi:hypothetical protein
MPRIGDEAVLHGTGGGGGAHDVNHARAAARHMIPRRSGVILAFGGPGERSGPLRDYYLGGTQVAFDAIETIRRQLSVELGPHGIRFVTLASGGVPETFPEDFDEAEQITKMIEDQTLLGRAATLEDVGKRCRICGLGLGPKHDGGHRQRELRRVGRLVPLRCILGDRRQSAAPAWKQAPRPRQGACSHRTTSRSAGRDCSSPRRKQSRAPRSEGRWLARLAKGSSGPATSENGF